MLDTRRDSDETEDERLNRQPDQLLQELRVAMPGVQVAVFIGLWFVLGLARRLSKERSREEAVPR